MLVFAGIHGNETAPPYAARALLSLELLRGQLSIVPEANPAALAVRNRYTPGAPFPNLNRNFPTSTQVARGPIAIALWGLVSRIAPAWTLDLHEGWGFRATSRSMGSSVVHAPHPSTTPLALAMAQRVLADVNATGPTHPFQLIEPGPEGSLARSVVETLGRPALTFETTWTQPRKLRERQHVAMVSTVLRALDMLA